MLTSLIGTCKRLGIDPFTYLRDIFERLTSHPHSRLAELLPDQWEVARRATTLS
ncbi:MAG: transposase domain-containing protein [Acidobacteriia bacterium]|nr:transposase domain-containing protein [Terriglobia bacterium]